MSSWSPSRTENTKRRWRRILERRPFSTSSASPSRPRPNQSIMTASAGERRLKVLFFAQRFPYPMDTGGKIRTGKLLEYLRQVFDVTLISNIESPKDDPYVSQVGKLCSEFYSVPWKEVKKYSLAFYLRVLRRMFSRYPISVITDFSPDLKRTLHEVLAKGGYDLLICDFLQPSINCVDVRNIPTLLFQHNVEAVIPRRHYETAGNPVSKIFWCFSGDKWSGTKAKRVTGSALSSRSRNTISSSSSGTTPLRMSTRSQQGSIHSTSLRVPSLNVRIP